MSDQQNELTREELEDQDGEHLPPREVMSTIDPDGGLFLGGTPVPVKPEEIVVDDPHPVSTET